MQYFFGDDTYAAREAIDRLAQEGGARVRWLDRADLEAKSLADWVSQGQSGMFGRELVVVRDVSAMPKSLQEVIAVAAPPLSNGVIWDRSAPDKRSKVFKALKVAAQEFSSSSEDGLVKWVEEYVSKSSEGSKFSEHSSATTATISREAARELVRRVGNDKWQLKNVLEVLFLTRSHIEAMDVREYVPDRAEGEIFAMLDALSGGNMKRAVDSMEQLLAAGESEFYILSMLAYQCKTLWLIAAGETGGVHPYVVQKNGAVAKRLGSERLLAALTKVMATDFAIKQGTVDIRTALVMLVTGLFL